MSDIVDLDAGEDRADASGQPDVEHLRIESSQTKETERLHLLYQEYRRITDSISHQIDHIIRVATIGFSATGALLILVSEQTFGASSGVKFEEWVYWLAPLMLTLLYAWIINHLYQMAFSSYYVRELEDNIAEISKITYFHYENTVVRALGSFRTGFPPYLITIVMPMLFAFAIYATLVSVSFVKLKSELVIPVWRLGLFVAAQCLLSGALLISAFGIAAQLRDQYDLWKAKPSTATIADDHRYRRNAIIWKVLAYAILPRPFDFVYKSLITIGALVVTARILEVPFSPDLFWTGFLVIFCVDFLAKQATYIWNDVLDVESDRIHPYKSGTRILGQLLENGDPAEKIGIALFLLRALASFAVAFLLSSERGLVWLPPLVVFIYVFQFVYDRWAKRGPLRRSVIAALGYGERALAGSLAAMSVVGRYDVALIVTLAAWIIVFMFAVLTEYWWAERVMQWETRFGEPYPGTGVLEPSGTPSIWFLSTAPKFERAANAALFVVGLFLAYLYAEQTSPRLQAVVNPAVAAGGNLIATITEAIGSVLNGMSAMWGKDVLSSDFTRGEFTTIIVGGSIAGILLMLALRRTVRRETRPRWLIGEFIGSLLLVSVVPSDVRLATVAFVAPLLVATLYCGLSYDEITSSEVLFKRAVKSLPALAVSKLFHPRGARITISPVTWADAAAPGAWPAELRELFLAWADLPPQRRHETAGDGGGSFDVLIEAPLSRLRHLRGESGLHGRLVPGGNDDAPKWLEVQLAWVEVRPVSVLTQPSMGSGLEVSRAAKVNASQAATKDASALAAGVDIVRYYGFRESTGASTGEFSYFWVPKRGSPHPRPEQDAEVRTARQMMGWRLYYAVRGETLLAEQ